MKELTKARLEIGLLFLFCMLILPTKYMIYDFEFWVNWSLKIYREGLTNVYNDPTCNYHPIYLYALYIYTKIQGSEAAIIQNINSIKLFPLFFDFLPIFVLCGFRQRLVQVKIPYLFLLLNIAYLYNTMIWGQVDSVPTAFVFLSLLAAFYSPAWAVVLFSFAIGTKLQAIIFLPVLVLILLYSVRSWRKALGLVILCVATLTVICLPFLLAGKGGQLWHVVTHAVGFYPSVSICAFNFWYLFVIDPYHKDDTTTLFILSYKHLGLLLFFVSSGLVLLTLLLRTLRLRIANAPIDVNTKQMLMLSAGLIALYFFYFNTQMHERYSHPMLIFFFLYAVYSRNYKLYILASIAYLLNIEKCMPGNYFPIKHYKIIFADRVIALWYLLTTVYGTFLFYKQYKFWHEWKLLKSARKGF